MRLRTLGIGAIILGSSFAASRAQAADTGSSPNCDPNSGTCTVAGPKGGLHYESKERLYTDIDTGSQGSGRISVRARFAIDPVGNEPSIVLDMPKGGQVVASWAEPGFITLKPITEATSEGTMKIHYTLTPSLEANIYGIGISYSAAELAQRVGGSFNYNVQATGKINPWSFTPSTLAMPGPALDQSRIFSIPLEDLGIPTDVVEGTLALHATTKPTFTYKTKEIRLDAGSVTAPDGSVKIPVVDGDFMDVTAFVAGDLSFAGSMDVKPYVTADTVAGIPTFGLVKFGFSVASKQYNGATPKGVGWNSTEFHIPLPNVKVPDKPIDMGIVKAGQTSEKTVVVNSTGELGAKLTITSSDPQFEVPSGTVSVNSKSSYDLKVIFRPSGDGVAASADITVKSNDPDQPEQKFHVAANGAPLNPNDPNSDKSGGEGGGDNQAAESGCACTSAGTTSSSGAGAFALAGLGLAALIKRRRR